MKIEIATTTKTAAQIFHMKGKKEYTREMRGYLLNTARAAA